MNNISLFFIFFYLSCLHIVEFVIWLNKNAPLLVHIIMIWSILTFRVLFTLPHQLVTSIFLPLLMIIHVLLGYIFYMQNQMFVVFLLWFLPNITLPLSMFILIKLQNWHFMILFYFFIPNGSFLIILVLRHLNKIQQSNESTNAYLIWHGLYFFNHVFLLLMG